MRFGKVSKDELDVLDLGLPSDHPDTSAVLPGKTEVAPKIYAGCAKWGRKEWVGTLYPEGTKDKEFLDNYVNHFNAIEINSTGETSPRTGLCHLSSASSPMIFPLPIAT